MGREEVWGRDGNTRWLPMLDARYDGWRENRGAQVTPGSVLVERNAAYRFGQEDWRSYELRFALRVLEGGNAQIKLRLAPDGKRFYMVDFLFGWQALGVSRVDPGGLRKLSVVNLEMSRHAEMRVEIAIRELSITTYVEGRLINQVTDDSFQAGPMAFAAWESKAQFGQPEFRVLA
jgi:hypothetical protein